MSKSKSRYKPRRQIIAEMKAKRAADEQREEKLHQVQEKITQAEQVSFSLATSLVEKVKLIQNWFIITLQKGITALSGLLTALKTTPLFSQQLRKNIVSIWKKLPLRSVLASFGHRLAFLEHSLANCKYLFFLLAAGLLIFNNLTNLSHRFPHHPLMPQIQALNFWPALPLTGLNLARSSFQLGYEETAFKAMVLSRQQLIPYRHLHLDPLFLSAFNRAEAEFGLAQQKETEKKQLEALLKQTPFSWELLLAKAKVETELGQKFSAEQTLEQLSWLYPELDTSALTAKDTTLTTTTN